MLRTELSEMRKTLEKKDSPPDAATAITGQPESSDSEEDWQYVYRNRKQKLRYRRTIKSNSNSSSTVSVTYSENSSDSGDTSCVSTRNDHRDM